MSEQPARFPRPRDSPTPKKLMQPKKYNFNDLSSESESNTSISEEYAEDTGDDEIELGPQQIDDVERIIQADDLEPIHELEQYVPDMSNLKGLVPARQAYSYMERFELDWPTLSLDYVVSGDDRADQFWFIGGAVTTSQEKPSLQLYKVSSVQEDQMEDSDSDAEASVEAYCDPMIEKRDIPLESPVLRIKSCTGYFNNQFKTGAPGVCAAWLEDGSLIFQSLSPLFRQLGSSVPSQLPHTSFLEASGISPSYPQAITQARFKYQKPGFALDWHPLLQLCVAGNQENILQAFKLAPSGAVLKDATNFSRFPHGSIEDIRFAHTGSGLTSGLFAACSTCGAVSITDPRAQPAQQMGIIQLSNADLNVVDFDYQDERILYAGDDMGAIFAVDLRAPQQPLKTLRYNQAAITSLKAQPTSGGTIAVSDDNGAVVFYQMDEDNDPELIKRNLPSEFLFLHCGNDEPRELTWCGSREGFVAIADQQGLQLIKPTNM